MTPWISIATTLAQQGLPVLAERLKKDYPSVARDIGVALSVPPSPASVDVALISDPDAVGKLAELELKMAEMHNAEVMSARTMMSDNIFSGPLAMFIVFVFALALGGLYFVEIPPGNRDAVMMLLGGLVTTGFGGVVGFFYGSSMGSKIKNETIARAVNK